MITPTVPELRKSDWLPDWYVLDCVWAVPEGNRSEWLEIIAAIKDQRQFHQAGRRVAVSIYKDGSLKFFSPRNCRGHEDEVMLRSDEVARWILSAEALLNAKL